MKNFLYTALGLIFIAACFLLFLRNPAPADKISKVVIEDTVVQVEVADTPELREQGLSGRESLKEGAGLLFVFDTPGPYGFWMKDMRFPIDIIWISESGQVIDVERGATPESYPQIFYPVENAKYVLETNVNTPVDTGQKVIFR